MNIVSILYKQVKDYIVQKWQHVDLIKKTRGSHESVIHLLTQMWLMFLYANTNKWCSYDRVSFNFDI